MKKIQNVLIVLLTICLLAGAHGVTAEAAAGSASLSGGSGQVGSTVTVSGTIKSTKTAIGAATVTLSYNPEALQYVSGSSGTNGGSGSAVYAGYGDGSAKSLKFTMKFKILKEGAHKISGVADAYNFDEVQLSIGGFSTTVTGKVAETNTPDDDKKSGNTKLSSLKVYPGTLSPAFSANTRSYTVKVPERTTEITVSATPQSKKAKFYVTGTSNLQPGNNSVKVVVTAENGTAKSYNITVMCPEGEKEPEEPEESEEPKEPQKPKTQVLIDNVNYTICEDFKETDIPDGFIKATITYDGKAFAGVSHEKGNLQLLYMENASDSKAFFLYNSETKSFYPFLKMQISEIRSIILLPMDEDAEAPEGMTKAVLRLQMKNFDAWESADKAFYVFNAMNGDGDILLYRYDVNDGTCQRYTEAEKVVEAERETILPEVLEEYYDYILIAAIGIILIMFVLILALAVNADKRRRRKLARLRKRREQ